MPQGLILLIYNIFNDYKVIHDISSFLKINGHSSILVSHGIHAWEVAARQKPSVAIMDMNAKGEDGRSLRQIFQESVSTREIPIMVLSRSDATSDVHRALTDGVSSYVRIPFDPPVFLAEVRHLLGYPCSETDAESSTETATTTATKRIQAATEREATEGRGD